MKYVSLGVGLLGLVFVGQVLAVDTPKQIVQDARQNATEMRQEKKVEQAKKRADVLEKYCLKTEARLKGIVDKIQIRAEEKSKRGGDISPVMIQIGFANGGLVKASDYCRKAVETFNTVPVEKWTDQQTQVVEARGEANNSKLAFVEVRKFLNNALAELAKVKVINNNSK